MDLDDGIIHCALASGRVFDSIQKSKRKKNQVVCSVHYIQV